MINIWPPFQFLIFFLFFLLQVCTKTLLLQYPLNRYKHLRQTREKHWTKFVNVVYNIKCYTLYKVYSKYASLCSNWNACEIKKKKYFQWLYNNMTEVWYVMLWYDYCNNLYGYINNCFNICEYKDIAILLCKENCLSWYVYWKIENMFFFFCIRFIT